MSAVEMHGQGRTILVIDDTPANLAVMVDQLERSGFRVVIAQDGAEGVKRAQLVVPDLILLDIVLPGMDGFETCRWLKALDVTKQIPVIFMTSLAGTTDKVAGFDAGGVDYVTKPFQLDEVLVRIRTHLTLRAVERQLAQQNADLQKEIAARREAEGALRAASEELEGRVERRTSELTAEIAERMRVEEALRKSEQMARGIIDTALDAFVQIDDVGAIVEWNPQAEQIFGWTRQEAAGKALADLIVPDAQRARFAQDLARLFHLGDRPSQGRRLRGDAVRKDGRAIKVEVAVTALRRGERWLFNGFARDVTEKLASEEQYRQTQKMEALGQLTGGIAHDFNNILTVITGTAEILGEAVADKPQLVTVVNMVDDAARRGAEMTQRLLAFARKQPLDPRPIDINALIAGAEDLLRPSLGEHIEIKSKLDAQTWPALVDPTQLTTALLNLAVNARDAMPKGGKLTLRSSNVVIEEWPAGGNVDVPPGPYVLITVGDTGIGIPDAIRGRVFDPFFTTKEAGKGTGLGLSMVYGFIKQSGGQVEVCSEEGRGTTFKLYLPRADEQAQVAEAAPLPAPLSGHGESILVVEDDALVRNCVVTQLESLGYRTLAAANAAEALRLMEQGRRLDLLFTDVMLPGPMNGRDLAEEAVKRWPAAKVLFTSGYSESALTHHGRLDSGVAVLNKPYRKADLARKIHAVLEQASG
jgi:PAS domain S-box-containing protein